MFDYKQYIYDSDFSNYFQLRVDEPERFLLFLRYGVKRSHILNALYQKSFDIFPLDTSVPETNHALIY